MTSQWLALGIIWRSQSFHIPWLVISPIGSMYGIYANIWGILMVNVTIYGIHGSYGSCHHVPHEAMTICSLLVIPWEKPWNSWEIPPFFGPKHAPCLPWVSPSVSATKQAAGQLLVEIWMAHDEPNGFNIINPPNPSISMDWWSKLTGKISGSKLHLRENYSSKKYHFSVPK